MVSSHAHRQTRRLRLSPTDLSRLRISPTSLSLGLLTTAVAATYSTFALFRFYQFNSATYDLVIFDQAIDSYAHFQPGISLVKGLHNGFGPHFSVLGDHFSPIIALLAPLYWIHSGPQDLLIAQSVLFALAIPWIWLYTRRALGGGSRGTVAAYLVAVAYALSWPIAAAVNFDFHEVAFVPLLTAIALERLQAGKIRQALVALGVMLLVKEDMGLLVAGIGVVLLVSRQYLSRQRLLAGGLIVAGVAATVIAIYVLIPAMGGRSDFYFAYGAFGNNVSQALLHMIEHPGRALQELITPRTKLDTIIWLFGAFAFLPLLSPITLAMIPLLLERMLASTTSNWWTVQFHYNAFLVVILILGAVDGGVRLGRWAAWLRTYWAGRAAARSGTRLAAGPAGTASQQADAGLAAAGVGASSLSVVGMAASSAAIGHASGSAGPGRPGAASPPGVAGSPPALRPTALAGNIAFGAAALICAMAVLFVHKSAFDTMFQRVFFNLSTPIMRAENAAVAAVPSGVTVATANMLGPHLAARDTVVLWDGGGSTPPLMAPWVLANTSQVQFTFTDIAQEETGRDSVSFLEHHGYKVVFDRLGYYVLHRGD